MDFIIVSFLIGGFMLFSFIIGRGLLYLFGYRPKKEAPKPNVNPYILVHEHKLQNDSNYEAYLEWMQTNKIHDAPFDKDKVGNESEVEDSIKDLLR